MANDGAASIPVDYRALCLSSTRDELVAKCELGFLVSEAPLFGDIETTHASHQFDEVETGSQQKILAVRKVQDTRRICGHVTYGRWPKGIHT